MAGFTAPVSGRIAIVGGGVIGLSIAYHLAARGHDGVVVLERDLLGDGATASATGGIRQQFSSPLNALICHEAVLYFEHFEVLVGEPYAFRQHGYLFTTNSSLTFEAAAAAVRMQRRLGIPARLLDPTEIAEIHPQVRTDDVIGGTYCATDGSGSPADLVQIYARQARRLGADIRQHCEVVGLRRGPDGAVVGVLTRDEEIAASVVIDAAGPWAGEVAQFAGVTVPLKPTPRQAFAIGPEPWLTATLPLTVDLDSGAYLHPETSGGVIGGTDRERPSTFDATVDMDRLEVLISAITHRFPSLADATVLRGWSGLREMTPDDHGIVGPSSVPGMWLALGFSGHGFQQAPIIGRELAAWLLTGAPGMDLSGLAPERFGRGMTKPEGLVF